MFSFIGSALNHSLVDSLKANVDLQLSPPMKMQSEPIVSEECPYLPSALSSSLSQCISFLTESIFAFQVPLTLIYPPWTIMSPLTVVAADVYYLAHGPLSDLKRVQLTRLLFPQLAILDTK